MKTFLTHLQERPTDALNPQFNYGGSSTGPGLDQYVPMAEKEQYMDWVLKM